jgi:hypothetical protein
MLLLLPLLLLLLLLLLLRGASEGPVAHPEHPGPASARPAHGGNSRGADDAADPHDGHLDAIHPRVQRPEPYLELFCVFHEQTGHHD